MSEPNVATRLEATLNDKFSPVEMEIYGDSHKHAGHAGARPEGETHFRVRLVSEVFAGANRVARQRMVYTAVNDLIPPIHALQLQCLTPDEV